MSSAAVEYQALVAAFTALEPVSSGQMFGKPCLKVSGKAFVAQHLETVVFKLTGADHASAMKVSGAVLWDPSGKGRAMKEWVALPAIAPETLHSYAGSAMAYVQSTLDIT